MEIEKKIEWLKPERIQKLYSGHKSIFGINRVLVVGIGKTGIDLALRCKHITQKRFGSDVTKMRFLGIGLDKLLEQAECFGTTLSAEESLPIAADESIYKYLNNPARLPQYVLSWFDNGLKNYSPATPTYGLTKRQCGRVALFHNIKPLMKRIGECISAFAGTDKSLEIVITGSMGDAFFGGMFIDLAYIMKTLFEDASYPVKVNCLMFAPDSIALTETDQRELGGCCANAMVTKNELEMFQSHKKPFSQRYSSSFEVVSDKPPFNAVLIPAAEKSYDYTLNMAAEKVLSRMEVLFTKDDDAERIMSYNMLKQHENHDFRCLTYGVKVREVPLGKILSYLSVRVFTVLNHRLNANSVGQMQLQQFAAKVTPDANYLAVKGGEIPELEFDERLNPNFSAKALKISSDGSQDYVEGWLAKYCAAAEKGAKACLPEIADSIISTCEAAKTDMSKGPFYSIEIIKKCLAELRVAMAKINAEVSDMKEQVERSRNLVNGAYMKVKTSALFVGKSVEQYIFELKDFTEYSRKLRTGDILLKFYQGLYDKLEGYMGTSLAKAAEAFENIAMNRAAIIEDISAADENSVVEDAFSVSDKAISEKLDSLVEGLSEATLSKAFRESGMLSLPEEDETALAAAMVNLVSKCFSEVLSLGYSDMCEYFGVENGVKNAVESCVEGVSVAAPTTDDFALNRVICPKSTKQDEIAELRAAHKGMNYIWNGSVLNLAAVCTQIKGGVRLEAFKDYNHWENMHYAYVNDSLKKHGIHIF